MKLKFKVLQRVKPYKLLHCDNALFLNARWSHTGSSEPNLMMVLQKSPSLLRERQMKSCSGFSELLIIAVVFSQVKRIKEKYWEAGLKTVGIISKKQSLWLVSSLAYRFHTLSPSWRLIFSSQSRAIIAHVFVNLGRSNWLFLSSYSNLCTQFRWCRLKYWRFTENMSDSAANI